MNDWIMQVPSIVFSCIKNSISDDVKRKYNMSNENFSAVSSKNAKAAFPFVYVKALPSSEVGADLEGTSINGINFSVQIDVFDNRSQQRTREVMSEIVKALKVMRFDITNMPEFDYTDVHRSTIRAKRVIGANDSLLQ